MANNFMFKHITLESNLDAGYTSALVAVILLIFIFSGKLLCESKCLKSVLYKHFLLQD